MVDEIVHSAAKSLDAPIREENGSWFIDAWVFPDPHDDSEAPRRQIVQLFSDPQAGLLYLSSTIGVYDDSVDLAGLLRQMVGALHCSLYISAPDAGGAEHLKIASAVELEGLGAARLSSLVREVALFADRFEAQVFGADVR